MLTNRDMTILSSLDKLGFASRSQLQKLHTLGSNRNACRVLQKLSPYLNSFRSDENIYYLNKQGRELVGTDKVMTKNMHYHHILMRNDAYILFGCPSYWKPETPIKTSQFTIVPDVFFCKRQYHFLEVDRTQKMTVNYNKIKRYKALHESGVFQRRYKHFPKLVWITTTDYRMNKLLEVSGDLPCDVYTVKDLR